MKPRLFTVLLLTLASVQLGCATTATWSEASRRESYNPRLVGTVREGPAGSGAATELVISYYTAISPTKLHEYYIALRLGKQGVPPPWLAYNGPSRTPPEIEAELSKARAAGVAHHVFGESAYAGARAAMRSARYVALSPPSDSTFGPEAGALVRNHALVIIGYRRDGTPVGKAGEFGVERFPEDCYLLLLPETQPRPAGERFGAAVSAFALTPFAVAFDIVTLPAQVLYGMTHR